MYFSEKSSAFTLIELLVVIVIIGILSTIGIAQFNSYQEKARVAALIAEASQGYKKILTNCVAHENLICENNKVEFNDNDFALDPSGTYDREITRIVAAFDIDYNSSIHTANGFELFRFGGYATAYIMGNDAYFCGERRRGINHVGTSFKLSFIDFQDIQTNRLVMIAEKVSDDGGSDEKVYRAQIFLNDKKVYTNDTCFGEPGMIFSNGTDMTLTIDPTNSLEDAVKIIGISYQ